MELGHKLPRKHQRLILAYYFLFFLLIVPFWWNLTKLDRRPLPKKVIHDLQAQKLLSYPLRLKWAGTLPTDHVQAKLTERWRAFHTSPLPMNISAYRRHLEPSFSVLSANATPPEAPAFWPTVHVHPLSKRPKDRAGANFFAHQGGDLTIYADSEDEAIKILSSFIHFFTRILITSPSRIPFSHTYELLFSYLFQTVPRHRTQSYLEGVLPYVRPFLDILLGPEAYRVTSQVQTFAPLRPGIVLHGNTVPEDQVPHFVNPTWHLAPLEKSTVQLIHYIPTQPLYILDEHQQRRPDNDYVVPRWGAVEIVNSEKKLTDLETQSQLIVSHLRTLFGVPSLDRIKFDNYIFEFEQGPHGISTYELLLYQHQHILTSMTVSIETLSALVRLVEQQTRLPIPEHLRDLTEHACAQVRDAARFDAQSYTAALLAREESESAFLDPRMVGMVYFPDEHLYAIYMPLFFPLLVNFMKTVLQEWRLTKHERAMARAKATT